MKGFSSDQLKKLVKRLDRARIHSREIGGRQFDYIEGWFAVTEANAIFGYAGWDREMAHFERVFERHQAKLTSCGYLARVRISVRAGDVVVVREGTGFGYARAEMADEAHERALKAAETDATKRALATFGNRFGLALYDKDPPRIFDPSPANGASGDATLKGAVASDARNRFALKTEDGATLAAHLSPEGFCSGLRQLTERACLSLEIEGLRNHNEQAIAELRAFAPELKNARGKHYADILQALMEERGRALAPTPTPARVIGATKPASGEIATANQKLSKAAAPKTSAMAPASASDNGSNKSVAMENGMGAEHPMALQKSPSVVPAKESRIALGPAIDKSVLALASPRRIRNKAHLLRVASKPCLICEESPCHAHHVTFAQPRGLSVKVSDEFTVPLCPLHHNDVHRAGPEEAWWRKHGLDPLAAALNLWQGSLVAEPEGR